MKSLSKEDKDAILNFYFRCGDEKEIEYAMNLIASDSRAAELYAKLEETLTALDYIKYEPCPDNLANLTITRLKLAAAAAKPEPEAVSDYTIYKDSAETARGMPAVSDRAAIRGPFPLFLKNFPDIIAVAAVLIIAASVAFPVFSKARQLGWQKACSANLGAIGSAMFQYANDNNGYLPLTAIANGNPWWKIGYQGPKLQSNTRYVWLLVKGGYIDGRKFICPGNKSANLIDYTPVQLKSYNDFPSRNQVSYSFLLACGTSEPRRCSSKPMVLAADMNPLFENVYTNPPDLEQDEFGCIQLNEKLRMIMSSNHSRLGQNILISGGCADFQRRRIVLNDDIFTVKNKDIYTGKETPCSPDDIFLVP